MMKNDRKLRRWELALALSLCITFCHGLALQGTAGMNWWGVIFPGLAGDGMAEQVETSTFPDGGEEEIQVRFRFLEWLENLL